MLTFIAGALLSFSDLPAPPPAPPFTKMIGVVVRLLDRRVAKEFKRCGYARTYSNGRYVEAMGTVRHSARWNIAARAMADALTVCRGQRQALRSEKDYLLDVIQSGASPDVLAATFRLQSVSDELSALERFFDTETVKYRDMVTNGWGDPHCVSDVLKRLSSPESLCSRTSKDLAR